MSVANEPVGEIVGHSYLLRRWLAHLEWRAIRSRLRFWQTEQSPKVLAVLLPPFWLLLRKALIAVGFPRMGSLGRIICRWRWRGWTFRSAGTGLACRSRRLEQAIEPAVGYESPQLLQPLKLRWVEGRKTLGDLREGGRGACGLADGNVGRLSPD